MKITMTLDKLMDIEANKYYIPAFIIVLAVNHFFAYKYRTNKLQTFLYTVSMIVFGFIGSHIGADVYNWFQNRKGNQTVFIRTVFGTILTVVIITFVFVTLEKLVRLIIGKIRKSPVPTVRYRDVYDAIQPGAFILVMFTKFRCLYVGCCYGVPCSWGIYSEYLNTKTFPVQIVEMVMTFCILIITWRLTLKKTFRRGSALFISGALWTAGRFFLEFLMYYKPEDRTYPLGLTLLQWACILIFAICVAVLTYLKKTQPGEPLPVKPLPKFLQRFQKKPKKETVKKAQLHPKHKKKK